MYAIKYSQRSETDLADIYDHYAQQRQNPAKAETVLNTIRDKMIGTVAKNPKIGKKYQATQIRSYLVEKEHRVFYTIDKNTILVSRILATRAIKNWDDLVL